MFVSRKCEIPYLTIIFFTLVISPTRVSDSEQPAGFWHKVLDDRGRANLVANIAGHLKNAKKAIRERTIKEYFGKVDATFAARIEEAMKKAAL